MTDEGPEMAMIYAALDAADVLTATLLDHFAGQPDDKIDVLCDLTVAVLMAQVRRSSSPHRVATFEPVVDAIVKVLDAACGAEKRP